MKPVWLICCLAWTVTWIANAAPAGSIDPSFTIGKGPEQRIMALLALPDNNLLVGGYFQTWNTSAAYGLVRLLRDGSRDLSFLPPMAQNSVVLSLLMGIDGKVLVGGDFIMAGDYLERT